MRDGGHVIRDGGHIIRGGGHTWASEISTGVQGASLLLLWFGPAVGERCVSTRGGQHTHRGTSAQHPCHPVVQIDSKTLKKPESHGNSTCRGERCEAVTTQQRTDAGGNAHACAHIAATTTATTTTTTATAAAAMAPTRSYTYTHPRTCSISNTCLVRQLYGRW